jgi:hypothetical protein
MNTVQFKITHEDDYNKTKKYYCIPDPQIQEIYRLRKNAILNDVKIPIDIKNNDRIYMSFYNICSGTIIKNDNHGFYTISMDTNIEKDINKKIDKMESIQRFGIKFFNSNLEEITFDSFIIELIY